MATTITLKNIPDTLYDRLKEVANRHHRSLNSEVISCLEKTLLPNRISPNEHLLNARSVRQNLPADVFKTEEIAQAIKQGRP